MSNFLSETSLPVLIFLGVFAAIILLVIYKAMRRMSYGKMTFNVSKIICAPGEKVMCDAVFVAKKSMAVEDWTAYVTCDKVTHSQDKDGRRRTDQREVYRSPVMKLEIPQQLPVQASYRKTFSLRFPDQEIINRVEGGNIVVGDSSTTMGKLANFAVNKLGRSGTYNWKFNLTLKGEGNEWHQDKDIRVQAANQAIV